jgi:hypothetical protein
LPTGNYDAHGIHAELKRLVLASAWPAAAELARTLPDLSAEDLNGSPNHDLWWHFAEPLADHLTAEDPKLARRLFDLVEMSYIKEASMASGPGEAASVQPHLARIRCKLKRMG